MSVAVSNLLTNSHSNLCFYFINFHGDPLKNPNFTLHLSSKHAPNPQHFKILGHRDSNRKLESFKTRQWGLRAFELDGAIQRDEQEKLNFDAFLSIAEVLCIAPSAVLSIGCAVNWVFLNSQKSFQVSLVNRVLVWQVVLLLGAVAIGALIRRRQWRKICRDSFKSGGSSFNLVERIEKMEEDLRGSATIIRVLSRHLEKLGIRFRVTRKALKKPIAERHLNFSSSQISVEFQFGAFAVESFNQCLPR